jgi:predicted AAA+ superfamily ATPase
MKQLYKRKLEAELRNFMPRREILVVRGPRQSGKTTLMRLLYNGVRKDKVFINLDLPEYRRALAETPLDFVRRFKKPGKDLVMFLDEIQRVENAGESLKLIFDEYPDVKLLVTGSSSLELKVRVLPPLVGRAFLFELLSFDFEEFLMAKDEGLWRVFREKNSALREFLAEGGELPEPSFKDEFLRLLQEYLIYGGYPEVIKARSEEEKIVVLKNIVALYLEKDITTFFGIEESSKFQDFAKVLAFNTSSLLSLSSVASDLKLSYRRAEQFLEILRHTYVVSLLNPFARNLVTELRKMPKVYFLDLGLRNSLLSNFADFDSRTDRGQLVENFVYRELLQFAGFSLHYWRTAGGAEVDFVLVRGEEVIPIEVRLGGGALGKGFYSFLKTYRPERAIVVTLGDFKKQKVTGTTLYWVPIFYF